MSIIYIISGNSLETFYEDTMQYLYEKYHPQISEREEYDLNQESNRSAFITEAYFPADHPSKLTKVNLTRRDRVF